MNSEKEDLPAQLAKKMIDDPGNFDARQAPEPYTQYVKHYLYMVKRERRDRENGRALESKARQTKSLRRTPKQQSSRRQSDPTKAPARSSQTSAAKTRKPGSIAEQAPGDSHPPEERN
ncbi:MAG: hypothetical protein K1X75_10735 [Leptospirales bacterium]|nr:hypothetical protein [Leptospirales bacterium]